MRRKLISILSALVVLSLSATAVYAGAAHFVGSVSFGISSLVASGKLAGLGSGDVTVILEGSGTGIATCTNKGGTEAPGQNPVAVSVVGIQSIPKTLIKNGSTPFEIETEDPQPPTAKVAGCPNNKWKVTSFFVFWTSAIITVKTADTGDILLRQEFTCTTTGSPNASVTCTPIP